MRKSRTWLVAVLAVGLVSSAVIFQVRAQIDGNAPVAANASVPELIPYRGYIEQNGGPFTNETGIPMDFFIVDAPEKTYAQRLWGETQTVPVHAGHFSVTLGSVSSFSTVPNERLFNRHQLYLGIRVNSEELGNKQRLLASPYAITSRQAQHFEIAGNATVGGSMTVTGAANVSGAFTATAGAAVSGGVLTAGSGVTVNGGALTANQGSNLNNGLTVRGGDGNSAARLTVNTNGVTTAGTFTSGGFASLNGGASVSNGLTVQTGDVFVPNGQLLRFRQYTSTGGNDMDLGDEPVGRSICVLSAHVGGDVNVFPNGGAWRLERGGSGFSTVTCFRWTP